MLLECELWEEDRGTVGVIKLTIRVLPCAS